MLVLLFAIASTGNISCFSDDGFRMTYREETIGCFYTPDIEENKNIGDYDGDITISETHIRQDIAPDISLELKRINDGALVGYFVGASGTKLKMFDATFEYNPQRNLYRIRRFTEAGMVTQYLKKYKMEETCEQSLINISK